MFWFYRYKIDKCLRRGIFPEIFCILNLSTCKIYLYNRSISIDKQLCTQIDKRINLMKKSFINTHSWNCCLGQYLSFLLSNVGINIQIKWKMGSLGIAHTRDCTYFLKIGFVVAGGGSYSYYIHQGNKSAKERKIIRK